MRELLETLTAWQGDGIAVGRAVVVRTFGSAPRPEGAVLGGHVQRGGGSLARNIADASEEEVRLRRMEKVTITADPRCLF